jgi:predicted aspartyl protease
MTEFRKTKKYMKKPAITLIVIFLLTSCISNKQNKGYVTTESTETTLDFTTNKTVIILPVLVDGVTKNYAFDTGAELSLLQKGTALGKTKNIKDAAGKKEKLGIVTIKSFKIGSVEFKNTSSLNGNMDFMTKQIVDFGGIIGQSIISKSNWLIDYTKNKIKVCTTGIQTTDFDKLSVKKMKDPHVNIIIEGETYSMLVDLGSSVAMTLPENSKLAQKLLEKYDFKDHKREIYRIGGAENVAEKIGFIEKIKIDNSVFEKTEVHILATNRMKIGNAFFKNYVLYIDNINGEYGIKKVTK